MPASPRSLARYAAPGFFIFLAACGGQGGPVATVNGQPIPRAELERQVRVYLSVRPGAVDNEDTRRQVLDQLVKQEILVQAARAEGLDRDPGRRERVAERRKALREELERSIAGLQAQLEALDRAVETKALIEAYSQAHRRGVTVTPKDLATAYDLRAAREPLPPLESIRDQLLEQVVLDRLVEQAGRKANVRISPGPL